MRIKFRGVRGSVPWSVPEGIIHGCNTPCIEVHDETTGGILVLDAGSGIVAVNPSQLVKEPQPVSLLLTHYHWDHLLGLPFFATLYQPGWDLSIYAPTLQSYDPEWLETLVTELGVEPSQRIQRLHQAILSNDPALESLSGAAERIEDHGIFAER